MDEGVALQLPFLISKKVIKVDTVEIKKMSTVERLQAMEAIWDSLLREEAEIQSPEWHQDVLVERKQSIEEGRFFSMEEVKARHQK